MKKLIKEMIRLQTPLPYLVHTLTTQTRYSTDFIRSSVAMGEKFALYHAFTNVHTPLVVHQRFTGASPEHGPYGDSVIELDHQVSTTNHANYLCSNNFTWME